MGYLRYISLLYIGCVVTISCALQGRIGSLPSEDSDVSRDASKDVMDASDSDTYGDTQSDSSDADALTDAECHSEQISTWQHLGSPGPYMAPGVLHFSDKNRGWWGDPSVVYRTENGGETWSPCIQGVNALLLTSAMGGEYVWVLTDQGSVYRSTDGGQSFDNVGFFDDWNLIWLSDSQGDMHFLDDQLGIIVVNNSRSAIVTNDGGVSWGSLSLDDSYNAIFDGLGAANGIFWVYGSGGTRGAPLFFKPNNSFNHWGDVVLNVFVIEDYEQYSPIAAIGVLGEEEVVSISEFYGDVLYTDNSWRTVTPLFEDRNDWFYRAWDAAFSGNLGLVVGEQQGGEPVYFLTKDAGDNWFNFQDLVLTGFSENYKATSSQDGCVFIYGYGIDVCRYCGPQCS